MRASVRVSVRVRVRVRVRVGVRPRKVGTLPSPSGRGRAGS